MKTTDVIIVRIYIKESSHLLDKIIRYLNEEAGIQGFSVFRAISGHGATGDHQSSWMDLSLDLPLVIEFFDVKNKIEPALAHLSQFVKQEHIVFWNAKEVF